MTKTKIRQSRPLVSIVTPSYNSGRFIEECIQSVLSQDYPYVEHIIQDGGSKDRTKKILKKYQNVKFKRKIKIFSGPDKGQSDALNKAIQKTKGDIILVLNADDILMPYAVSWGVENIQKYSNASVIYGDQYVINEKGEIIYISVTKEYRFGELLCIELIPPAQASFIRRSALEKVGFWADATLDTCPDYEMWIRLAQKFPMKHVFGVITKYRIHRKPRVDSRQPRLTQRFVAAKKEVMDRLFNLPNAPKEIKKLKGRAYAGLDLWASEVAFHNRQPKEAVFYLLRSFFRSPTLRTFIRIIHVIRLFINLFFLRILKLLRIYKK